MLASTRWIAGAVGTCAIHFAPPPAYAETYLCNRPAGWTATESNVCLVEPCEPRLERGSVWTRDELLRANYLVTLRSTELQIEGVDAAGSNPATHFSRTLPIVYRDEERAVATQVTDNGVQILQLFPSQRRLHWIDSHSVRMVARPSDRLQAFVSDCRALPR